MFTSVGGPTVGKVPAAGACCAGPRFAAVLPVLLLLALPLFLAPAVSASGGVLSEEARTCLTCHASPGTKTFGDKTTVSVRVDGEQFAGSVHGSLGCTSCHSDVSLDNHPSAKYTTKREFALHVVNACRTCHSDIQLMASQLHQRAISRPDAQPCSACHGSHDVRKALVRKDKGSVTQYCLSCHAKPLTRSIDGKTISLTIDETWVKGSVHRNHECIDCHTSYSKEKHPSPKTFASGRELSHTASESCERCHSDKALLEKDSIHAALLAEGDQRAPGCSDCHGAHQVGPAALTDTLDGIPCKKCHLELFNAYRTSVHGMTKYSGKGQAPLCAGCHKSHDVKPAMASRSPRAMCLACHPAFEADHRQWLPNPQAHLEMVACTACHVPRDYKRSIYLRLVDAATGKLLSDVDMRKLLEARGIEARQIKPKELWQLSRELNEGRGVTVAVAVSMNDRLNAHYLAPKDIAVKQCEMCHSADSSFFQTVAVAVGGPDGREVLHDVDPRVLRSVYGAILLKRFYVMSGTRLTAMDYVGALVVLGGIAVPILHGTARLMTKRLRRDKRQPGGRGKP